MAHIRQRSRRVPSRGVKVRRWLVAAIVGAAIMATDTAGAQSSSRPELRVGLGTFLTRDRGWNYSEPVEVFAVVSRNIGAVSVEAGGSMLKTFRGFSAPAISPRPATAFHDGFAARLHVRGPNARAGFLNAIVGAELFHNRTDGESRATTVAGTAGVGLSFGPARRGAVDLRYVRFAKPLGSSRGILPLTLSWKL
ncbi:MAG TPA: hypothetical protein VNO75_05675 [Gemmatimonadaceae bacterium]|nr:hypothetical protein [Gemmatimonadaceae bacterium]